MSRWFGPAFAILLAALAILSLRGGGPGRAVTAEEAGQPRYTLRGVDWQRFDEQGQREFQGSAESITYFDDESAQLSQFEMTLLLGDGAPWTVRAPRGRVPAGERSLVLFDGVVGDGRWPDGETLRFTTPELQVDSARKRLATEAAVELTSRTRRASSRGLRADGAGQRLQLLHDVRMRHAAP